MELQLQTRTYHLTLGQWKIPFDTMLHYATKLNLITEKGRWCDLGVDSVFVTTLLTDFFCGHTVDWFDRIHWYTDFSLHTVDWLNLILSKTNGGGEQVTSEPCIAWSLIIQFLSPARDRAGRIALLPPLFHGLTAVATRLLVDLSTLDTVVWLVSLCDSNTDQRCDCYWELWLKNQPEELCKSKVKASDA